MSVGSCNKPSVKAYALSESDLTQDCVSWIISIEYPYACICIVQKCSYTGEHEKRSAVWFSTTLTSIYVVFFKCIKSLTWK